MKAETVLRLRQALESMVTQFGFRGVKDKKPVIHTGRLSALEEAFEALDWDDPHELPENGHTCEVEGCMEADICGTHWAGLYLHLCREHSKQQRQGKARPRIKSYALRREATRDPVTGWLP